MISLIIAESKTKHFRDSTRRSTQTGLFTTAQPQPGKTCSSSSSFSRGVSLLIDCSLGLGRAWYIPLCAFFVCDFKWTACENLASQKRHTNGFSPLWMELKWVFRFEVEMNLWPHSLQGNGLTPVCVIWCLLKWANCLNLLSQGWPLLFTPSQWNGFSPVWILWWVTRLLFWWKYFWQTSHW